MKKPYIVDQKIHSDDRGFFLPLTNNIDVQIKRVYVCGNYGRDVIRGFHYHKKEIKLFNIVRGSAKFICINPDDPSKIFTFVLSERTPAILIIPPGYANGWMSLDDNTLLIGMSNATLEESIDDDIRYDPLKWGSVWEGKGR